MEEDEILDSGLAVVKQPQKKKVNPRYPITYIFLMFVGGLLLSKGFMPRDILTLTLAMIGVAFVLSLIITFLRVIYFRMRGNRRISGYPLWYVILKTSFYCWTFPAMFVFAFVLLKHVYPLLH